MDLLIYTYVGDILIALNPFQNLSIYSPQVRDALRTCCFLIGNLKTIRKNEKKEKMRIKLCYPRGIYPKWQIIMQHRWNFYILGNDFLKQNVTKTANVNLALTACQPLGYLIYFSQPCKTIATIKPIWHIRRLNIVKFTPLHECMKPGSEELGFELSIESRACVLQPS